MEREPVQRITPYTENELRWKLWTILSEQINVNERIILKKKNFCFRGRVDVTRIWKKVKP